MGNPADANQGLLVINEDVFLREISELHHLQCKERLRGLAAAPTPPASRFTQADLERGSVMFKGDGANTSVAGFNVVVADHTGATSGAPQTVKVHVRA